MLDHRLNKSLSDIQAQQEGLPQLKPHPAPSQGRKSSFLQWFYDLPIGRKQLIALLASELVSLVGLSLGARWIIENGLRTQLLQQAKSEVAVTEINYNIKVNQMGFGFRGQADNAAIIAAAKTQTLSPALRNQVKQILQNEIKARKIEYATLVGKDLRIIVNANTDRKGEVFNPNNLVKEVFSDPRQIKASAIVSWAELAKESPPLPPSFHNQDALIRYTVTPVKDPETKTIIGALVSGDIVNGKWPIVKGTLKAFGGGYSAVYLQKPTGEFTLATALDQGKTKNIDQAQSNIGLPDISILAAAAANGEPVTARMKIGGQTYTLAAKALPNIFKEEASGSVPVSSSNPVAILVRGTSETDLNQLLNQSLLQELTVFILVLIVILVWAIILRRAITKPIQRLRQTTQEFSKGDRQVRAKVFATDEIGQLTVTFNEMAESIEANLEARLQETERANFFTSIATSSTSDYQNLESVFKIALTGARELLKVDRAVIYRFNSDWSGYITTESIAPGWKSALNDKIEDACIGDALIEAYIKGRVVPTANVFEAGLHPEHIKLMERLQIKANLVTPIVSNDQLYGLLIAHHCDAPHTWQQSEIDFLKQLAGQLGLILDRESLLEQRQAEVKRAHIIKDLTVHLAQISQPNELFDTAVSEVRQAINSDRVIVYSFNDKWQGTVIAESVAGWPTALGAEIADPCFADKYVEKYRQGRIQATENIYKAGLTPCHIKQLEPFAVKANLVAPIIQAGQLLGLLIAHQCSAPRAWQQAEIDLFAQCATQVGFALDRLHLLEQQKKARELLQYRALELLKEVDPVSKGDLTIRASVTEDEIGTIADSYNATINSLCKIVTQVQAAAQQVTLSTTNSEDAVQELSQEALRQAEEIAAALERIQEMSNSIQAVVQSAQQAEVAVQQATQTAAMGDAVMNRTVEGMLSIRETVVQTSKKVKQLGESSQKISKVLNLIGRFAAQTNLLALKASIEAARAGEEGRGFAVLADEVRVLARQSAEATAEIESLISNIQAETNAVVAAMEAGTEQVVAGTKLVDETRQSLNKINEVSQQISELVAAIAAAASAQSQVSQIVSGKMTDVAASANQTSNEATVVSASFKEILELAQQLQASAGKFKVS